MKVTNTNIKAQSSLHGHANVSNTLIVFYIFILILSVNFQSHSSGILDSFGRISSVKRKLEYGGFHCVVI
jgi:hypothetical protein